MGLVVAIDSEAASEVPALVNRDARDHIGLLAREHGEALGEKKDGLAHSYTSSTRTASNTNAAASAWPTAWRPRRCASWFRSGTTVATRSTAS
jgi:hypothetical protein